MLNLMTLGASFQLVPFNFRRREFLTRAIAILSSNSIVDYRIYK